MDEALVTKAVSALQMYHSTSKIGSKPKLIEDDPYISLVIALKRIPDRTIRPRRIPLLHPLFSAEETEMCLITKKDKADAKELLKEKKVTGVSKVIPISKLKTNYKSFEAKRQLSACYDIFLVDKRLYQMLPRLLGKKFYEKKKFPIPVDMQKKELAHEIKRARDSTYLHIGLGSCCYLPIGRVGFPSDHLVENILTAIKGVASKIPQGLRNIQSVHIKTPDSLALPVYNSLPPPPTLLPALDHKPITKRIKLGDGPAFQSVDKMELDSESEEDTQRKRKTRQSLGNIETMQNDFKMAEAELESGGLMVEGDVQGSVGRSGRKAKILSKISAKKVRGSTVRSSKYEKALRRRTVN